VLFPHFKCSVEVLPPSQFFQTQLFFFFLGLTNSLPWYSPISFTRVPPRSAFLVRVSSEFPPPAFLWIRTQAAENTPFSTYPPDFCCPLFLVELLFTDFFSLFAFFPSQCLPPTLENSSSHFLGGVLFLRSLFKLSSFPLFQLRSLLHVILRLPTAPELPAFQRRPPNGMLPPKVLHHLWFQSQFSL